MRLTVSRDIVAPFDKSRALATPTSVPPRLYFLRSSNPRFALARTSAGGENPSAILFLYIFIYVV